MKKNFYIFCFAILGALLGLIVVEFISLVRMHGGASGNLSSGLSDVIILFGTVLGLIEGQHWWRVIYVEKRYATAKKFKLEHKDKKYKLTFKLRWHGFSLILIIFALLVLALALWN